MGQVAVEGGGGAGESLLLAGVWLPAHIEN